MTLGGRLAWLLRRLWAGPWSVVGLLLAPGFRRRRAVEGVLLCEGASWPGSLRWRYRAITFGHVVLAIDELDHDVWRHELAHVGQYERWGPFFVPAYLVGALWSRLRGGHHHHDNPFETAARRASGTRSGAAAR